MNAKKPNLGCKHSEIPIWKSPDLRQQRTRYPLAGTPTLSKVAFGAAAANVSKVRTTELQPSECTQNGLLVQRTAAMSPG
jgi:hypothetical protein